jgi:hypothetical protein
MFLMLTSGSTIVYTRVCLPVLEFTPEIRSLAFLSGASRLREFTMLMPAYGKNTPFDIRNFLLDIRLFF